MVISSQDRIAKLEKERTVIEDELKTITENLWYFESSQLKYDEQISALESKFLKSELDMKGELFLKKIRNDLIERISNLSALRLVKVARIDKINKELKRVY